MHGEKSCGKKIVTQSDVSKKVLLSTKLSGESLDEPDNVGSTVLKNLMRLIVGIEKLRKNIFKLQNQNESTLSMYM